jgi:hypothetical protein
MNVQFRVLHCRRSVTRAFSLLIMRHAYGMRLRFPRSRLQSHVHNWTKLKLVRQGNIWNCGDYVHCFRLGSRFPFLDLSCDPITC